MSGPVVGGRHELRRVLGEPRVVGVGLQAIPTIFTDCIVLTLIVVDGVASQSRLFFVVGELAEVLLSRVLRLHRLHPWSQFWRLVLKVLIILLGLACRLRGQGCLQRCLVVCRVGALLCHEG